VLTGCCQGSGCQGVVKGLSGGCQGVVRRLSLVFIILAVVRGLSGVGLSGGCQGGLSGGCQGVVRGLSGIVRRLLL